MDGTQRRKGASSREALRPLRATCPCGRLASLAGFHSLRAGRRQRAHADFLEPHYVTRVMVLQTEVARLGTLRPPFRLVPLFLRWQVRTSRIERRDALTIEVHKDFLAR